MGYDYKKHLEEYEKEKAKVEKIRNERIYMAWQEDCGKLVVKSSLTNTNLEIKKAEMLETARQKESIEKYLGKKIIEKLENLPDKNRIKLKNEEDNIFGVKRSKTKHVEEMAKKETPKNKKKKKQPQEKPWKIDLKL